MPSPILHPDMKIKLELSFEVNEAVELSYVREFIIDALESWGGQRHPDDPLFGSLEKVSVKRLKSLAPKRN